MPQPKTAPFSVPLRHNPPAMLGLAVATLCISPVAAMAKTDKAEPQALEELFVTAAPHQQNNTSLLQGHAILTQEDIIKNIHPSLGDSLAHLPGVSTNFHGPGASRPIIRGLGGERVRILVNSLGSIDAGNISPDHAVAADGLSATRIEVLHGASSLAYGSNAIGGVVNIIDQKIPDTLPGETPSGFVHGGVGSNADEWTLSTAITTQIGQTLALHLGGFVLNKGDYAIPGEAESAILHQAEEESDPDHEDEHEETGHVENSNLENKGGSIGLSHIWDSGFIGASFSHLHKNYGVPAGHLHAEEDHEEEHEEDHAEEEDIRIDLRQSRLDLSGQFDNPAEAIEKITMRFGYASYRHEELEGDEIGTVFKNDGWEGRVDFAQTKRGQWQGSNGIHLKSRSFSAEGEEAFSPPSRTQNWGIYSLQELALGDWRLDMGGRLEHQAIRNNDTEDTRRFTSVSGSTGVLWKPTERYQMGVALSRTARAPSAEELYSDGPHLATQSYERGNPDLDQETAIGLDIKTEYQFDKVIARLNLYYNWYDDFIFDRAVGELDGLVLRDYIQRDIKLYGAEFEANWTALQTAHYALNMDFMAEFTRASQRQTGEPLPRIPAHSITVGAELETHKIISRLDMTYVDDQTRTALGELPTEDYINIDATVTWHPFEDKDLAVIFQVRNLTNAEQRVHSSYLKDLLPLPGRDIRFSTTYRF